MADETGNDVRPKQGIDIVTRLREHGRLVAGQDAWDAADEIERLRDAGDALADYLEGIGHDGPAIVLSVWREVRRG